MGLIEKRPRERSYRARSSDPLGEQRSKTFARKGDAQRFRSLGRAPLGR